MDKKNVIDLQIQNDNIIDIVASLNSTYLALKATLSDLTKEVPIFHSYYRIDK